MDERALRDHLARLLEWGEAHVTFDVAVEGIASALRGVRPPGLPHSPWELLEHLRFTQRDILDFCRDPAYAEPEWPAAYWPATAAPPDPDAWDESVAAFRADRQAMQEIARRSDLLATIPHGSGQTYLREILLVADHTSHHLGQMILVRRALGDWPPDPTGRQRGHSAAAVPVITPTPCEPSATERTGGCVRPSPR